MAGCCFLIAYILVIFNLCKTVDAETGILYAKSAADNSNEATICIAYNSEFHTLPPDYHSTKPHRLGNYSTDYGCVDIYEANSVEDHIVAVLRGNCTFATKAALVQNHNATGLLAINNENETSLIVPGGSEDDYKNINIIVATMMWKDFQVLNNLGNEVFISMYAPVPSRIDPNMACILGIALFCVGVGGYWSGIIKHESKTSKKNKSSGSTGDDNDNFSPLALIILTILACVMLVSLYFFYDYLVYAVIVMFTIAGSVGLFFCLQHLWKKLIPFNSKIPINKLPFNCESPEIRSVILYLLCASFSIYWAVQRHESYAWILQDILGTAVSINMLKTLRLGNLKVCTILLVLLFFYDIFFVFITPLFTKTGKSIMVDVATGGNSSTGEQIPVVFKFPRLLSSPLSICGDLPFSLLGLGDVLVPGLLISHNHCFDIEMGTSKVYFISSLIAYTVGLGFTFLALGLMEMSQPALLYLVPCTLLTTFTIGLYRGEFRRLWFGIKYCKKDRETKRVVEGSQTNINRSESTSTLSSEIGEDRVLIS